MRLFLLYFIVLAIPFSCSKQDKELGYKYDCDKLNGVHKFIYEPIVISEECNCIVAGKVKYLKDCKTVALIYYGNGECNNLATKIICENGNCFDKNENPINSLIYSIDCNGNNITEGLVSYEELEDLSNSNSGPQP